MYKYLIILAIILILVYCGKGSDDKPTPIPIPPPPKPPPTLMVCFEWDFPSLDTFPEGVVVQGFRLYKGKVSEQYHPTPYDIEDPTHRDVCIVDPDYFVEGGTYFFAITAYGTEYGEPKESDFSNEVMWEARVAPKYNYTKPKRNAPSLIQTNQEVF